MLEPHEAQRETRSAWVGGGEAIGVVVAGPVGVVVGATLGAVAGAIGGGAAGAARGRESAGGIRRSAGLSTAAGWQHRRTGPLTFFYRSCADAASFMCC